MKWKGKTLPENGKCVQGWQHVEEQSTVEGVLAPVKRKLLRVLSLECDLLEKEASSAENVFCRQ